MVDSSILGFLKRVALFSQLNEEELGCLTGLIKEKVFEKGTYVFEENTARTGLYVVKSGQIELVKRTLFGEEKRLSVFERYDFLGEGALMDDSPHSTSARAVRRTIVLMLSASELADLLAAQGSMAVKIYSHFARVVSRRMQQTNTRIVSEGEQYESGRTRIEHDLLGERRVPQEYYYGVQTLRAMENFNISGVTLTFFPVLIQALAMVKMGAARANFDLGLLPKEIADAIEQACFEIINGKMHNQFVVDMIQGGAGTSTNMNANEVIANRALELLGHERGEYQHCHPNSHVNLSQSTNDAYPTAVKIALVNKNKMLIEVLRRLVKGFREKGEAFSHILKMGRTQLQDAVPMTLGQEFEAYAATLEEEIVRLKQNARLFLEINMGATAIGTGINADPDYADRCLQRLRDITGLDLKLAPNLVEATQDTGAFIMYSSAVKRLAVKLSKICNDLRLLSSGPRAGIFEIRLPEMQPGSSIMPGKVNPVIPEVVNQIAFKVIGNDLTVTLAAEAGQLELNVMEPVIVHSIFESIEMLKQGMNTLLHRCIKGIRANEDRCREMVEYSIGLVTALNPVLGYEICTRVAKKALDENRSVYDLVLEGGYLSREELDEILKPQNMIRPQRYRNTNGQNNGQIAPG